jgi:hypothetical protein
MHNLLLGTTKRMLKIWKMEGLLRDNDFKNLHHLHHLFQLPEYPTDVLQQMLVQFKNSEWE